MVGLVDKQLHLCHVSEACLEHYAVWCGSLQLEQRNTMLHLVQHTNPHVPCMSSVASADIPNHIQLCSNAAAAC